MRPAASQSGILALAILESVSWACQRGNRRRPNQSGKNITSFSSSAHAGSGWLAQTGLSIFDLPAATQLDEETVDRGASERSKNR